MKTAVIVGGIPNPTSGGGALTAWSVVRSLVMSGHHVAIYDIASRAGHSRRGEETLLADLAALGQTSYTALGHPAQGQNAPQSLASKLHDLMVPDLARHFPAVQHTESLAKRLQADDVDVAFAYHFDAAAVVAGIRWLPRLAIIGDPIHLPDHYRWRALPFTITPRYGHESLQNLSRWLRLPRLMRAILNSCDATGAFAAHHANWLANHGVIGCQYYRTPVPDDVGPTCLDILAARPHNLRPRLLLIGHLKGIATLSGLSLFLHEVVPILDAELGPDGYEVRLVGGYEPPPALAPLIDRPNFIRRGQVEPATEEFLSSDVLLVPTPIPLGIRVRIITGFAHGSCIVTHAANAQGIPELQHGDNSLIGPSGTDIARCLVQAMRDAALRRRLSCAARKTYETMFSLETAGLSIVHELERLASRSR